MVGAISLALLRTTRSQLAVLDADPDRVNEVDVVVSRAAGVITWLFYMFFSAASAFGVYACIYRGGYIEGNYVIAAGSGAFFGYLSIYAFLIANGFIDQEDPPESKHNQDVSSPSTRLG